MADTSDNKTRMLINCVIKTNKGSFCSFGTVNAIGKLGDTMIYPVYLDTNHPFVDYPFAIIREVEDQVICVPLYSDSLIVFSNDTTEKYTIDDISGYDKNQLCFVDAFGYEDSIYLIGFSIAGILKIQLGTNTKEFISIPQLKKYEGKSNIFSWGCVKINKKVYIPVLCTGAILCFDLITNETQIIYINKEMIGCSGMTYRNGRFFLNGIAKNDRMILEWDCSTENTRVFEYNNIETLNRILDYYPPLICDDKIYLFPHIANDAFVIDIKSGESCVNKDLYDALKIYRIDISGFSFLYEENGQVLFQDRHSLKVFRYDILTGEIVNIQFSEQCDKNIMRYSKCKELLHYINNNIITYEKQYCLDEYLECIIRKN